MRAPKRYEATDGTVTWKVRYRSLDGRERSETFRLKADAETFSALMGNGEASRVADALDWLARKQGHAKSVELTFGAWFETYVDQLTGVTSRTRDDYHRQHDRYLKHLDDRPLTLISRVHVTDLVNSMDARGLSPKTIKNAVYMLAACFALAVDEGVLVRNPTKRVRLPRMQLDEHETRFLTFEEYAALREAMPEHYRLLLDFLVGTGLRWSEATALQKRHVDLTAGTVRVQHAWKKIGGGWQLGPPKAPKSRRSVNAATRALVALHDQLDGKKLTDYVFTTPRGNVVRHSNFYNRIWKPACERAGLDPRPRIHDLRHTHASWLISDGVRLEAVQDQLGHESILTTRAVYGHLLPAVGVEVGRVASAAMERALAERPKELE